MTLDVTNEGQIQAAAKRIKGCGVPLVGLVNNAGIGTLGAVEMVDLAAVKKTMDVNFFSVVRLTQVCPRGDPSLLLGAFTTANQPKPNLLIY